MFLWCLQAALETENDRHHDLLQGSFRDAYRNMTYKHVMALKWVLYFCPGVRYVLKADDDTFVNTPVLMRTLTQVVNWNSILRFPILYCIPPGLRSQCRVFQGMSCLRPLKHGDYGLQSDSKHGCLFVFILYLCRPVYSYLLCGLVVRATGCRPRGLGLDSRHYQIF
jgi:hypothetical protein